MNETKNIIEGLLFAADGPLSVEQIRFVLENTTAAEIRRAIDALAAEYENRKAGIILREAAGGFQLITRPKYKDYIHKLREPSPVKLSRAAMETLAIVAYRQPVLKSEIEHLRGVNSGNTLRFLLEKKLIRVLGRRDVPGRPLVYGTTKKFLETFDLKDIKDLPKPEEIDDPSGALSGSSSGSARESSQTALTEYETTDLPFGDGSAAKEFPQPANDETPDEKDDKNKT